MNVYGLVVDTVADPSDHPANTKPIFGVAVTVTVEPAAPVMPPVTVVFTVPWLLLAEVTVKVWMFTPQIAYTVVLAENGKNDDFLLI